MLTSRALYFFSLTPLLLFCPACKTKQKESTKASTETTVTSPSPPSNTAPKISGRVSHTYEEKGCGTVIIVPNAKGGDPQILIPHALPAEFDVDSLEILFHYHPLKIKNPPGCMKGSPAGLLDIEINKKGK